MTTNLTGKVAIVTGAAQGIGEIYAGYLAGLGATVVLADLADDAVQHNAARLEKKGLSAFARPIDIADPLACEVLIAGAVKDHGALDILVNNAAVYQGSGLLRLRRSRLMSGVALSTSTSVGCSTCAGPPSLSSSGSAPA